MDDDLRKVGSEQKLDGVPGQTAHLPGQEDPSNSAAGVVAGGSALDTANDPDMPGEEGLNSSGDTEADDADHDTAPSTDTSPGSGTAPSTDTALGTDTTPESGTGR
ncbi:hypothetical protein OSC27_05660 [Microbacterium sp. STN6]|uniref:hypothetical protein n=1 Tax=Microbacterium sp. STN6 TaxID=2995588 RepID=UPI002260EC5B|nr:hypothetical protein [Microbacterium sp. STN6]MCX7521764.1 hypothetical protein [Microbacterium sp. STN6]